MSDLKAAILQATNKGLDVFKHLLGAQYCVLNKAFKSPFYPDTKASCYLYFDKKSNQYKYKDFGNNEFDGDCFQLWGIIHNLNCHNKQDFIQILHVINEQLHLQLTTVINERSNPMPKTLPTINKVLDIQDGTKKPIPAPQNQIAQESQVLHSSLQEQALQQNDWDYWSQYGITKEVLQQYQVIALQQLTGSNKEGKEYQLHYSKTQPMYGYKGRKHVKIYRPHSKFRFLYTGTLPEQYLFGFEQLPLRADILFITGGEKDVMSLAAKGFHAISLNSETAHLPKNILNGLTYRFKHIVLLYDVDDTGIAAMEKLTKEYQILKSLRLPLKGTKDEKDISDYFRLGNTAADMMQLFVSMLDKLYEDTFSILQICTINFDKPPIAPEPLISINDVTIGTEGNLLCITGAEGSGKTNYLGGILSGAIKPLGATIDTLGTIIRANTKERAVLLYDTEQSEYQLYKNVSYILKRAGRTRPPDYYKAICLMGISRNERMNLILESMDSYYYQYGGIHMVVIDGIADLIGSVNDEESSVKLIEELFRISAIYKTCIVCVLHMTPSGMKLRGHLGSEVQRKAAGILMVEKDDKQNCSVVKALKVRDGSPLDVPLIQFGWSKEEGRHVFLGEKSKTETEERKLQDLNSYAQALFQKKPILSSGELSHAIMEDLEVKERMARNYIKFMKDHQLIEANETNPSLFNLGMGAILVSKEE
jgi:energy-coupling factor transporter ATP-binding protein EcfA2